MEDSSSGLLTTSASVERTTRTGGKRRRDANVLPRVILCNGIGTKAIFAAIVVSAIFEVMTPLGFQWHIQAFIPLVTLFALEPADYQYRSPMGKLKPTVVERLARAPAIVGGSLLQHVPEYDPARWMVMTTPDDVRCKLQAHDFMYPLSLELPENI